MGRDKETGRDKVEDTDRDNVKEIDRANDSKTIRDYSKSQLKETYGDKLKRQTAIVVPSYKQRIVRQSETIQRAS